MKDMAKTVQQGLVCESFELPGMAGRSGYPNISGRVFRAFKISGFENWNPKFADKN